MAYCAYTDVQARARVALADLTAETAAAGISWADARINGRIRSRYTLPFAGQPAELLEISADLAAYFIIFERFLAGAEDQPVEAAQELRRRAESELELLAEGKLTLAVGDTTAAVSSGIRSSTYGTTPSLKDFDGLNRPDYTSPARTPLAPMIQTAPEGIDGLAGDR